MSSSLISVEHQLVSLAISKLDGRAIEWALTCGTSVELAFPTWDTLKLDLLRVFSPPNQAYRVRSLFLSTCQGKNELTDYFQELSTMMAAMQSDPLPEKVYGTVFMEGLRTNVARTEMIRVHPLLLRKLLSIAQNAEQKFKSVRLGWNGYSSSFARATSAST